MNANVLDRFSSYLLLMLTTFFWATNANLARAVHEQVPALGLSYWRWAVAWLILMPFVWQSMRAQWVVAKQHTALIVGIALFGVFAFNSLLYLGLQTTSAVNAVLMQSVCPVFIIALSAWWLKERSSWLQWLGVLVSLLGVITILARGDFAVLRQLDVVSGDWFVLTAVVSWAIYTVLLRKLPLELRGLPILGYSVTIGSWLLLPCYLIATQYDKPMPFNFVGIGSVLFTALFASLLAYLFWNHATAKLGANRTGQFIHLIPVFGVLIATLALGESLHSYHWVGGGLVAFGLLLSNWRSR